MNPLGAVMGALKFMPASLARQALEKVNPGFKNYFSKALAYGVDANRALDFLSERFESDAQKEHRNQLDKGAANQTLRPDEMVSRSQMQNADIPGKLLKTGLSAVTGGLLGGAGGSEQDNNVAQSKSAQPSEREIANQKLNQQESALNADERRRLEEFEGKFGKGYVEKAPKIGGKRTAKGKKSEKDAFWETLQNANNWMDNH